MQRKERLQICHALNVDYLKPVLPNQFFDWLHRTHDLDSLSKTKTLKYTTVWLLQVTIFTILTLYGTEARHRNEANASQQRRHLSAQQDQGQCKQANLAYHRSRKHCRNVVESDNDDSEDDNRSSGDDNGDVNGNDDGNSNDNDSTVQSDHGSDRDSMYYEVDMDVNQDQGYRPDMGKSSMTYCELKWPIASKIVIDEASPSEDEAQALAALHRPQGKLFLIKLQTPVTTYPIS